MKLRRFNGFWVLTTNAALCAKLHPLAAGRMYEFFPDFAQAWQKLTWNLDRIAKWNV